MKCPLLLIALLAASPARPALAGEISFNYAKHRVLETGVIPGSPDRKTVSPAHVGADLVALATVLIKELETETFNFALGFLLDHAPSGGLLDRILTTFSLRHHIDEHEDFKSAASKYIHAMGVCSEAKWKIDRDADLKGTVATGLFAKSDTPVDALVRISTSVENATWVEHPIYESQYYRDPPGNHHTPRAWGLGIKLFPGGPDEIVMTQNILFFDRYGLDGDRRPLVMNPAAPDRSVQFINLISDNRASAIASRTIRALFAFFDVLPSYRPLDGLAEMGADGKFVQGVVVPTFLILRARPVDQTFARSRRSYEGVDFRDEMRSYANIQFDIYVAGLERDDVATADSATLTAQSDALQDEIDSGDPKAPSSIGTLTLGRPVVSKDCDLTLHFPHDKNRVPGMSPAAAQ